MAALIEQHADAIRAICRRRGVQRLFLVGSVSTGDDRPGSSDVDFLVEFLPGHASVEVYLELSADLGRLLGRPVDLIERGHVRNPVIRASLERSKVSVYAAA